MSFELHGMGELADDQGRGEDEDEEEEGGPEEDEAEDRSRAKEDEVDTVIEDCGSADDE